MHSTFGVQSMGALLSFPGDSLQNGSTLHEETEAALEQPIGYSEIDELLPASVSLLTRPSPLLTFATMFPATASKSEPRGCRDKTFATCQR